MPLSPPTAMSDTAKDRFSRLLFYVLVLVDGLPGLPGPQPVPGAARVGGRVRDDVPGRARSSSPARIGPNRAALVTTLMAAVLIVAPAVMLVSVLAREVPQVIDYVQQASLSAPDQIERLWQVVRARVPISLPEDPTALLREGVQRGLAFLAPAAGGVVADVLATLGSLFVMLFALVLPAARRPGARPADPRSAAAAGARTRAPDDRDARSRRRQRRRRAAWSRRRRASSAASRSGCSASTAPVIWGVATAFCSLMPVVGSALVWVPAALWLLLSGEVGARRHPGDRRRRLGIGMVDNVLRPLLLSGRTSASGLVVFLGLLGGASAFGFIGLVLGPIILVTAGSLLTAFTRTDPAIIVAEPAPRAPESAS